jgi:hypothetical protein
VILKNAAPETAVQVQLAGVAVTVMLVAPPALWLIAVEERVIVVHAVAAGVGVVGVEPPPHADTRNGTSANAINKRRMKSPPAFQGWIVGTGTA